MERFTLPVQSRTVTGKRVAVLRRAGVVPAVLYGPGMDSLSIQVDAQLLGKLLGKAGRTNLVTLTLDEERYDAMVHEIQRHPIRGGVEHVDFLRVQADRPVRVEVPIILTGQSPAVRLGGALIHGLQTLMVEARPQDLPHTIQVDLARLENLDSAVRVRDLPVGDRVRVLADPDALIVRAVPARAETAAEAAEAATPAAPASPTETEKPA